VRRLSEAASSGPFAAVTATPSEGDTDPTWSGTHELRYQRSRTTGNSWSTGRTFSIASSKSSASASVTTELRSGPTSFVVFELSLASVAQRGRRREIPEVGTAGDSAGILEPSRGAH
jgi:hypothetical protein